MALHTKKTLQLDPAKAELAMISYQYDENAGSPGELDEEG